MSYPYRIPAPKTWVPCWGLRTHYVTDTHVSGTTTTEINGAEDTSIRPTITLTMLDELEAAILSKLIGDRVTRVAITTFQLIWCDHRLGAT